MGPSFRRHPLATFLLLAFGLTWLVWVPRAMASQGLLASEWPIVVGQAWSWGPAVAALLAAAITGGRAAVRELGARLVRWRVGWPWYAVVLAGPAAFSLAVAGAYAALGGSWVAPRAFDGNLLGLIPFFVVLALTDGLGEELGWRGYALPRLLARHGALAASLSLGVVWALWHLPLFWTEGAVLYGRPVWLPFLELPAEAVIYTWIFQHTRGSALPAVLLHASSNLFALPQAAAAASWGSPCSAPRRRGCWRSLSSRPSGRVASRAARDRRRRRRPEPRRPWVR
jgi:membrane protease YdiL (CAAX protease family)